MKTLALICSCSLLAVAGCIESSPAPVVDAKESPPPEPDAALPTLANGLASVERVFVRDAPDPKSKAIGSLRHGARFDMVEETQSEDPENAMAWYRLRNSGWVASGNVRVGKKAPPKMDFIPVAPNIEDGMPYRVGRVVAEDGVDVFRRPPKAGTDEKEFVLRRLQKGYFFTIDKTVSIYKRRLHRGTRYWFIPREGTTPVRGSKFEGIPVDKTTTFPFLWVTDPTARLCNKPGLPRNEPSCTPLKRHSLLGFIRQKTLRGSWYETSDGSWVSALQVARITTSQRPDEVGKHERWIHVDLRNQFAALYEGNRIQFVTLISSGDKEHETPTGTFRVQSKHITATMDDENNLSSPYFIQDVPWVLYYKGSYALHGAFWHDRFGLKTSHGCVNLSPTDARRFFEFANAPALPTGFHSVYTRPRSTGTVVHITR